MTDLGPPSQAKSLRFHTFPQVGNEAFFRSLRRRRGGVRRWGSPVELTRGAGFRGVAEGGGVGWFTFGADASERHLTFR